MQVNFYTFSKRRNSTARPSADTAETVNVSLKDGCTINNPSFLLALDGAPTWNYAQAFGKYYFVEDVESVGAKLWRINCTVDVLATYRQEIGNTSAYIARAASEYNDNIVDTLIPATSVRTSIASKSVELDGYNISGTYALTVISGNSDYTSGFATTYYMSRATMNALVKLLTTDSVWENITQFFTNPMDAIVECYWMPINISSWMLLESAEITVGNYKTGISANTLARLVSLGDVNTITTRLTIPYQYNDYRESNKFVNANLYHPFVGWIPLDVDSFDRQERLEIKTSLDTLTGNVVVDIGTLTGQFFASASGNIKAPLPVGKVESGVGRTLNTVGNAVASVGSFATGNAVGGVLGALNTIESALKPTNTFNSGAYSGSFLAGAHARYIYMVMTYAEMAEPNTALVEQGRPLCESRTISELRGYIQTSGASVRAAAESQELDEINAYLDGGFFYE